MRDHRPTSTDSYLSSDKLGRLKEHALAISEANKILKSLISPGLREHCRAANLADNHLIIEVASAAIQMKLNYERIQLLNQLRSQGYAGLMGIRFKINPALYQTPGQQQTETAPPRPPVSDQAAEYLRMTASMASSEKVKKRLERIADLAKKK